MVLRVVNIASNCGYMPATDIFVLSVIELYIEIFTCARVITVYESFLGIFYSICTNLQYRMLEGLMGLLEDPRARITDLAAIRLFHNKV